MGGRIGYSAATGIMVIILSWFGVISLMLAIIPVVAISPILLYIGMLIGAQAFQSTPKTHAPAIVLSLAPHLAGWCKTLMDGALAAAGTTAAAIGMAKLAGVGVLYQGLSVLGGGSILAGLHSRGHRRLRDRQEIHRGLRFRLRRGRAHLLRLHAWRIRRLRGDTDGRGRLRDRGCVLLGVEPCAGERTGPLSSARGDP